MVTSQHEGLTKVATFEPDHTRQMLLALFDLPIPKSGEGRLASPDLSEADPAVCRADGALLYGDGEDKFGIIVETQRGLDKEKPYSWLEYIANFRSREKCPVCLIVICPKRNVARWALRVIETGHPGLELTPLVIHSGNTPVITDVNSPGRTSGWRSCPPSSRARIPVSRPSSPLWRRRWTTSIRKSPSGTLATLGRPQCSGLQAGGEADSPAWRGGESRVTPG